MAIERTTNGAAAYSYKQVMTAKEFAELCDSVVYKRWEANEFLEQCIADGMLEDIAHPFDWVADPFVVTVPTIHEADPAAMSCLEGLEQSPRVFYARDFDQLERTPEIINSQINFHSWTYSDTSFNNKAFEISRFIVPKNRVGIVRSIQTGLGFQDTTPASQNVPRWPRGDAFWHRRSLGDNYGDFDCDWMLRTETMNSENNDPKTYRVVDYDGCSALKVPGLPFSKLPFWQEMAFLWGSDHGVFWIIPENTILSLWVGNPNNTGGYVRYVQGMLKGYTQPQGSPITFENLTKAW